ncbi:MAG TPA: branched-chain amino acid ABC transporter permease [Fimbriimonadaceae bacterium]|nr:branched-chain amino acid ABC transporter permease [Fimbriimonadaceae bacterium]
MGHGVELLAALNLRTLPEQLANGIFLGAIYALIALGYTMVYGILRLINFAHGEVYMLGAYVSLFASRMLGFGPTSNKTDSSVVNLLIMLTASMIVCACVGVIIERFAYRPMRAHSRIASLITAIGVSLLLQYGGALFLPSSPPPSINEKVIPPVYRESSRIVLQAPPAELQRDLDSTQTIYLDAKKKYDFYMSTHQGVGEFDLAPDGQALHDKYKASLAPFNAAQAKADERSVVITVRHADIIILVTSVVLMGVLTYLVMFTKSGRAMRAVSHDFDSAALMGVNVNNTITFTFVLGSALAGAGSMMQATLKGPPLTTFFGFTPGVKAFVAAVLGGIGNIPGAVLGGLLMGVAEDFVIWLGYSNYSDAIAFVILIIVLLFRPGGILGSSKVEKV